jgi:hypothetical protein
MFIGTNPNYELLQISPKGTLPNVTGKNFWRSLSSDGTQFVLTGTGGYSTSPDGINWTFVSISATDSFTKVLKLGKYTFTLGSTGDLWLTLDTQRWHNIGSIGFGASAAAIANQQLFFGANRMDSIAQITPT